MSRGTTLSEGVLRLACIDSEAPPLFHLADGAGNRRGYEPAAAALAASVLGLRVEWAFMAWDDMLPAVRDHRVDAVWCGQGIIPERQAVVDFTDPYAVFDETVLDRKFLVSSSDSLRATRELTEREGIFAGISSGAVLHVARRIASELQTGDVVCLLADGGWKYLSTQAWAPELERAEKGVAESLWW